MTTLLLRLAAPLQSWGTSSRFVRRTTDRSPSRSGVIGMLAAAQGRRRTDPLEDLLELRVGVRVDQTGQMERDFQTARTRDGSTSMPLSYRFYLADAVFAVAVEGDADLLQGLDQALRAPAFPLYLGRRSCPPAGRLLHGLDGGTVRERLTAAPWLASPYVQRRHTGASIDLDIVVDCPADAEDAELVRDEPISFDPRERQYGWRTVHRDRVRVANPAIVAPTPTTDPYDPMAAFEEIS
ncbi:type I-E CRISPR-associated protein Cas5/CasD [Actinosynnema sp. NPDC047251]|uniref:CRISPR-associated protein cas5 family protein n=1 Tax=Saccharothrix espanaensis (strain ATCC 51144 / DSM 44229 / JCM 9112 / NBRC 15066 / NRRL 15764) TaxID=1179773 RepID=K0JWY0_SACES|nr:type I-E CRISPR-associated protein Cas5/CasD [Saccharothrix espanaensis]CCH29289.1 CRISPR-associated protein cas5 family protein [Saccharothrix espanaensis DSM 44229]